VKRAPIGVLFLMLLLLPAAPTAIAAPTVDQEQLLSDSRSCYAPHSIASRCATGVAQTFTAGLSGELSLIELELQRAAFAPTTESLSVQIRAGDPSGAVLATASVPAASIPLEPTFAWVQVSFGTPATVIAGATYAIVLPPGPFTETTDPTYLWTLAFADVYVNGVAWDHYDDTGVWQSYFYGSDRTFRTYVDISAPPDEDHDGVLDADDVCPGTVTDAFPQLMPNRYSYDRTELVSGHPKNPPRSIQETGGCSAMQIIAAMGLGAGHERFGLSRSALEAWIAAL